MHSSSLLMPRIILCVYFVIPRSVGQFTDMGYAQRRENPVNLMHFVTCDGCNKTICGIRYKVFIHNTLAIYCTEFGTVHAP